VLRAASGEPVRESAPTFPLRAVPEPQDGTGDSAPTFTLRTLPEPPATAPGTVAPPKGAFGPPPQMDAAPRMDAAPLTDAVPPADAIPQTDAAPPADAVPPAPLPPAAAPARTPGAVSEPAPLPTHRPAPRATALPDPALEPDPDSRPTPARGFDAVAEAVLGDEPPVTTGFLAEPMAQVNEAVKAGRLEAAAQLAESTVGEASAALGPDHAEVLKLRELTAYIAYLAGDPVRSLRLSLDLARIHRRTGDAEAAYGNIQSAASAWRAVRDPHQGLDLGHDLLALWTDLTAEDGPAAEDIEQLESARARMGRLEERARKAAPSAD
jgi:hypothetical protein